MKLISETLTEGLNYLTETKNGKKSQYIEGVFLQGELKNRNNRVYPINILEREVNKYIEELGGVPETLLSIGMIGPIILAIVGLVPQILGDGAEAIVGSIDQGMINSIVNGGLMFTLIGMMLVGIKAHTKDPGL